MKLLATHTANANRHVILCRWAMSVNVSGVKRNKGPLHSQSIAHVLVHGNRKHRRDSLFQYLDLERHHNLRTFSEVSASTELIFGRRGKASALQA